MANDVLQRIRSIHSRLSKGHKKIANIIANDPDHAAYITASRLAARAGVSESTVIRFASELGYEGYSEFQLAVQEIFKTRLTPNQRIEFTKQRMGRSDILEKVMQSDIQKIRSTFDNLNRDVFYKSVDAILSAKTIYIMGARSTEPIARILNYNLSLIFDNVKFVNPTSSAEVFEQMFSIGSSDLLFAFSFGNQQIDGPGVQHHIGGQCEQQITVQRFLSQNLGHDSVAEETHIGDHKAVLIDITLCLFL